MLLPLRHAYFSPLYAALLLLCRYALLRHDARALSDAGSRRALMMMRALR